MLSGRDDSDECQTPSEVNPNLDIEIQWFIHYKFIINL